jgi:hypothetical protein
MDRHGKEAGIKSQIKQVVMIRSSRIGLKVIEG